jgi:alpha-tubulin suppressor-like RCC1 family protein
MRFSRVLTFFGLGVLVALAVGLQPSRPALASSYFIAVSAGGNHSCALTSGHTVKCWGYNGDGQLGDGTAIDSHNPVDVCASGSGTNCPPLSSVTAISAGAYHTCAVITGGGVKCWGLNDNDELGDGHVCADPCVTPVDVCATGAGTPCGGNILTGVTAISAGDYHTCAVITGGVKCWGLNFNGQLGDGTTNDRYNPVDVCTSGSGAGCPALSNVTSVSAGSDHTCARTTAGGVQCWGNNGNGELGDGTTTEHHNPVDVCASSSGAGCPALSGVTSVSAGFVHTCARSPADGLKCWGYNPNGQLGDGTTIERHIPVAVCASGSGAGCPALFAVAVEAGFTMTCAVSTWCWGLNASGELGIGTKTDHLNPVFISSLYAGGTTAVSAGGVGYNSAGEEHACAVVNLRIKCWGFNGYGQVGDGTSTNDRWTPVQISGQVKAVGGIAELANVSATPLQAADGSGRDAALIAVAAAAGALAIIGSAWYLRRRLLRG